MTGKPNITRTVLTLAMTVVIALTAGSLALAMGDQAASGENAPQVTEEQTFGGCPCGNLGANVDAAGRYCPGRNARQGGKGMRHGQGQSQGQGMGRGRGGGCRMQRGMGMGQGVMEATRALVHDYRQDIVREVEDIENGVATTTRSPNNPDAVAVLQRHVGEMENLLGEGGRIRAWDPLFSEIFDHHDEIEMVVEQLPDGVRVIETSDNPEVVKLIRAHARKVNEFVARGPAAVHEPTPLPADYQTGL